MNEFSKRVLSNPDVKEFHSTLAGYFYQCWDLDAEGPEQVVANMLNDLKGEERERFLKGLIATLKEIENHPDIKDLILGFGQNYDPSCDGLTFLEWYVDLKS